MKTAVPLPKLLALETMPTMVSSIGRETAAACWPVPPMKSPGDWALKVSFWPTAFEVLKPSLLAVSAVIITSLAVSEDWKLPATRNFDNAFGVSFSGDDELK